MSKEAAVSRFQKYALPNLLADQASEHRSIIELNMGYQYFPFKLCSVNTSANPHTKHEPKIATQVKLIGELLERSIPEPKERAKILKDSKFIIDGREHDLSKVMPIAEKVSLMGREMGLNARMIESFNQVTPSNEVNAFQALKGVDATWLDTLKHTQSMEALYLHIDNAPFASIVQNYTQTKGNLIMYAPHAKSTEGSLGKGQRTVIMGEETTTPQGFIQSARLMAGERIDNILTSGKDNTRTLAMAEFEHGKRLLFDAMPAYEVLENQIRGREWENKLISEQGYKAIMGAVNDIRNMENTSDVINATNAAISDIGRELIKAEYEPPAPAF